MGIASELIDMKAVQTDLGLLIEKKSDTYKVIALAGNPNVGKSTVFNKITGLNQHTGNWPGKTVSNAQGNYTFKGKNNILVDIPGTYSLMAHSYEEEVARDFICFGNTDGVVVVCDATCLERNLNLVLQTIEITENVIVCVNLMDEAKKKHISIDFKALEKRLGVPIVATNATRGDGVDSLMNTINSIRPVLKSDNPPLIKYPDEIEKAVSILEPAIIKRLGESVNPRWISLRLLEGDESLLSSLNSYCRFDVLEDSYILAKFEEARTYMNECGLNGEHIKDMIVSCIVQKAEEICQQCVSYNKSDYNARDRRIDRILTSKWTGTPVMLALLAFIFWLTISGANYPSEVISSGLFWLEQKLIELFNFMNMPEFVTGALVLGVYRVAAWVFSVMLPPMAIFFPLFTLLEDLGYLPRVAFNLDNRFKKCNACGKQALTMWMVQSMLHFIFIDYVKSYKIT